MAAQLPSSVRREHPPEGLFHRKWLIFPVKQKTAIPTDAETTAFHSLNQIVHFVQNDVWLIYSVFLLQFKSDRFQISNAGLTVFQSLVTVSRIALLFYRNIAAVTDLIKHSFYSGIIDRSLADRTH